MPRRPFAAALEDDWLPVLEAVAGAAGHPTPRDFARLAARVAELSAAYNDPRRARASAKDAGAARLGFSFARDVPKAAAAVRELLASGWREGASEIRALDLGAGLGAATWGVARALEARHGGTLDATWVDTDAAALDLGVAVVRERLRRAGGVAPRVRKLVRPVTSLDDLPRYDVVIVGALLSELDVEMEEGTRAVRHATLVGGWVARHLEPGGAVVVLEPALRDRTRHLHRVRDALLRAGAATVLAPCLHQSSCPMLAAEGSWCHEDLPVDLPGWLAPVARAAGLRREGLTFSYLVLGAPSMAPLGRATTGRARVVSSLLRSKGKREAFLCSDHGELQRTTRLDRDATAANAPWDALARGDVVTVTPAPPPERPRVGPDALVTIDRVT